MVQTVNMKSFVGGIAPITPTQTNLFADITIVTGANAVAALPRVQFSMVWMFIKWKAIGTVLASINARFADNVALTTNPISSATQIGFANLAVNSNWITQHFTDFTTGAQALPTNAQVGLFATAPTGTFTIDARYEIYPVQ